MGYRSIFQPKVDDFPAASIVYATQFSGGDKPHPYLPDETLFAVAGFILGCRRAKCRRNRSKGKILKACKI
jgi:hypothetical protein